MLLLANFTPVITARDKALENTEIGTTGKNGKNGKKRDKDKNWEIKIV